MDFFRYLRSATLSKIELIPFLSLFLLLFLMAFILRTSFIPMADRLNLTKTVTSDMSDARNLAIVISGENTIYVDGNVTTIDELKIILNNGAQSTKYVLIKADRRVSFGRVVELWDLCRTLGIERVNIATNKDD